jgi:transcription antitermination factor NusA-like protein
MPLPICARCAGSGVLCPACEAKLAAGGINEFDIEASRVLYEIFGEAADLTHAVEAEGVVILIAPAGEVGKIIGRGGENLRKVSDRLGRRVRVVGNDSLKELVTALAAPARIRGVNTVYLPGGGRSYRVRIDREDSKRLRMRLEDLGRLVSAASGQSVHLAFD